MKSSISKRLLNSRCCCGQLLMAIPAVPRARNAACGGWGATVRRLPRPLQAGQGPDSWLEAAGQWNQQRVMKQLAEMQDLPSQLSVSAQKHLALLQEVAQRPMDQDKQRLNSIAEEAQRRMEQSVVRGRLDPAVMALRGGLGRMVDVVDETQSRIQRQYQEAPELLQALLNEFREEQDKQVQQAKQESGRPEQHKEAAPEHVEPSIGSQASGQGTGQGTARQAQAAWGPNNCDLLFNGIAVGTRTESTPAQPPRGRPSNTSPRTVAQRGTPVTAAPPGVYYAPAQDTSSSSQSKQQQQQQRLLSQDLDDPWRTPPQTFQPTLPPRIAITSQPAPTSNQFSPQLTPLQSPARMDNTAPLPQQQQGMASGSARQPTNPQALNFRPTATAIPAPTRSPPGQAGNSTTGFQASVSTGAVVIPQADTRMGIKQGVEPRQSGPGVMSDPAVVFQQVDRGEGGQELGGGVPYSDDAPRQARGEEEDWAAMDARVCGWTAAVPPPRRNYGWSRNA